MKTPSIAKFLLAAVLAAPLSSSAVLIDIGPSGQRVEPGAESLSSAPANNTNGANFGPLLSSGGAATITINNLDTNGSGVGGIDWRDRGDSSSSDPLVLLGEDFVKNNGGIVRLTLSGLAAGTYNATSYHIDPGFTQSQNIQVFLDEGSGFSNTGAVGNSFVSAGGVNGLTTALVQSTAANFQFTTDGNTDVVVVFDGRTDPGVGENGETPLTGFNFTLIPEPSSAILSLLGGLAFIVRRRR